MTTDLYTKTVLTVIAASLVWSCVNEVMPKVMAQTAPLSPMRVLLVDEGNLPLQTAQGLSVHVTNPSVAVAIASVQRQGVWDPLEVRVQREPPTLMPVP